MKKRLKKKRHIGNFAEYGFKISFKSDSIRIDGIDDFIDQLGKYDFGGGWSSEKQTDVILYLGMKNKPLYKEKLEYYSKITEEYFTKLNISYEVSIIDLWK